MTGKKQLKARVRARMAKTGESYTAALRHVAGRPSAGADGTWTFHGGRHPNSSTITGVLANQGVAISEPMVFLAGGGIGAGYILWEFKHNDARHLVLGFRNQWQYPDRWTAKTLARLGVGVETHRTSGAKGAATRLTQELDAGRPCVVLPDQYHAGYWHLPPHMDGHGGHPVIVYRRDETHVFVDDRGRAPIRVPRERMDAARARVSSYKNVMHVLRPAEIGPERLAEAALAGLRDCAEHLSASSDSFSLPAWRKWSRMLTDRRGAKGWPNVFADGRGLAGALLSMWEAVEPVGTDGGNLRDLFADALDEASTPTGLPLGGVAADFRHTHALWHDLAEAAFPTEVPEFARMRELTAALRESVAEDGAASAADAEELWELRAAVDHKPPVDDPGALFAALATRLAEIWEAETAAIARLRDLVAE
ncbi:BtrH N-terminal domain-containing protein [Sphaerisporangium aureirubrum]|uniref:BtrH N-terminal domain-containing protein n=1 Tax=Sphaerisporangium aureirubrum TaxID=1544736 RepID=A0ABW1NK71_9ACTN